jgi:hypothetical protein
MDDVRGTGHKAAIVALAAVLLAGTTACYEHTFTIGNGAPAGPIVDEEWHHHWLWGLISPNQELQLREECASPDATIEAEESFLNGLVAVLTGGIYSPTTVRVRCGDGTASLELNEGELARIVSAPEFMAWVGVMMPERSAHVAEARREIMAQ